MKGYKVAYWIATTIVALSGSMAGIMYFVNPMIVGEFKHLGFPGYFRIELGVAQLLGAFAIILPMVPNRIKEWAYAGFAINFASAIIAHIAVEGMLAAIAPLIALLLLFMSYFCFHRLNKYNRID
ncbi:MAG TPA: DoxX family protein [Ginsengibacter sp.]